MSSISRLFRFVLGQYFFKSMESDSSEATRGVTILRGFVDIVKLQYPWDYGLHFDDTDTSIITGIERITSSGLGTLFEACDVNFKYKAEFRHGKDRSGRDCR